MISNIKHLIVFGFNIYGEEIAKALQNICNDILIVDIDDHMLNKAKQEGFNKRLKIDMDDDFFLKSLNIKKDTAVFCTFADTSINIFLTISLRLKYKSIKIVAIGQTKESLHKLKMAGANEVITIEETGANIIYNMLINPHISSLLENILDFNHNLQIFEITINKKSPFKDKTLKDLTHLIKEEIIILGIVDKKSSQEFVVVHNNHDYKLNEGDTLVVMGDDKNIVIFKNNYEIS